MDFFDFVKTNKFIILFISIITNIILLGTTGYFIYQSQNISCDCSTNNEQCLKEDKDNSNDKFFVEVKGAVKTPGVYEANNHNIINDIINIAGGFTKDAYTNNINLSRKVTDELVIYVYTKNDYKKKNQEVVESICNCSSYDISNCTDNKQSEIVASTTNTTDSNVSISSSNSTSSSSNTTNNTNKSSTTTNQKKIININTATKSELTTLSGIGDAKAEDIINYRTQNGNFKSIDDIKNVKGIGDAIFAKIKDYITV